MTIWLVVSTALAAIGSIAATIKIHRRYGGMTGAITGVILAVLVVLLVVFGASVAREESKEDGTRAHETYVGYMARWEQQKRENPMGPALPEILAIVTTSVRLRERPSTSAKVVRTLPAGTRAKVFHWSPFVAPPGNRETRVGDWFKVNCEGDIGWVNGHFMRPALKREFASQVTDTRSTIERALFPEKTLGGKVFGALIGIAISVLASFLRVPENIEIVRSVFPISYFLVRGMMRSEFTGLELALALLCCVVVGVLLDRLSTRIASLLRR